MKKLLAVICLLFTIALSAQEDKKPAPKTTYIKAGRLFDATSDSVKTNMVLVVEDERIMRVGSAAEVSIPKGATVIDLSGATVLPGLIDCHTHITSRADKYDEINNFKDSPFDAVIAGVVQSRVTLNAGFTTIRDVGSPPFAAVDLRRNI